MTRIPKVPVGRLTAGAFAPAALAAPQELLHFVVNVGDGDCQLLVLPAAPSGRRAAVVVDVKDQAKLSDLISQLEDAGILDGEIALVVATHPHEDHIAGMSAFIGLHEEDISEFWEPGFLGTKPSFHAMMVTLAGTEIQRRRPTSGSVAVFDNVRITVLTPSLRLRHQFVTHGLDENNASLTMRVEFPAARVRRLAGQDRSVDYRQTTSLLLGADAQAEAWSHAFVDFPRLRQNGEAARRAMKALMERDPLSASVFKVPHHASKHGVHLELAERVGAFISLISCAGESSSHSFPHEIARAALRLAKGQELHGPTSDDRLGIHYTGALDEDERPLGTICVKLRRGSREVWRFGDAPDEHVNIGNAQIYA